MAISGSMLFAIIIITSAILVLGVGGQSPTFVISTQATYEVGHMGFFAVNAHNQWWGRVVNVYAVSIRIDNGTITTFGISQLLLWPLQQRSTIVNFNIPQGTPTGTGSVTISIWYTQTTLLLAGQEGVQVSISTTITVIP